MIRSLYRYAALLMCCLIFPSHAADLTNQPIKLPDVKSQWISAISNDNNERLFELLQRSKGFPLWEATSSNGKTALMVACKVGDAQLARTLVDKGANIRAKTVTDGTAFMFSVLGDQLDLAIWLSTLGADIDARGSNGWTSVMIAAAKGLDETLAWLLEEGADAHMPDVYGFSPLIRAADNNHAAAVKLLLQQPGVDIDWQDELDNTALHYAVSAKSEDIVEQLIDAGANASIKNRAGLTAKELVQ